MKRVTLPPFLRNDDEIRRLSSVDDERTFRPRQTTRDRKRGGERERERKEQDVESKNRCVEKRITTNYGHGLRVRSLCVGRLYKRGRLDARPSSTTPADDTVKMRRQTKPHKRQKKKKEK